MTVAPKRNLRFGQGMKMVAKLQPRIRGQGGVD